MKATPLAALAALMLLAGGALAEEETVPVSPMFDEALVATDPVVMHGEMVAEYHKYYGSAALMLVNDTHAKVARKGF